MPKPASDSNRTDGKEQPFTRPQVIGLVLVLLFLSNVPLVCLIWLWPGPGDLNTAHTMQLFWWEVAMRPEQQILLVVAFSGLLGGSIQMLLRIREDFGLKRVNRSNLAWYFLTPPIGAILAVAFYLVVRGGFFASGSSVKDINLFAFAGIGVLVGLFADAATQRLEQAFAGAYPAPVGNGQVPNPVMSRAGVSSKARRNLQVTTHRRRPHG
jgi:hypothetical protein